MPPILHARKPSRSYGAQFGIAVRWWPNFWVRRVSNSVSGECARAHTWRLCQRHRTRSLISSNQGLLLPPNAQRRPLQPLVGRSSLLGPRCVVSHGNDDSPSGSNVTHDVGETKTPNLIVSRAESYEDQIARPGSTRVFSGEAGGSPCAGIPATARAR